MRLPNIIATAGTSTGGVNEVERDRIAGEFREAFEADVEEEKRAELIYELNEKMRGKHNLYIEVGKELGTRYKNAIRAYVDMHMRRRFEIEARQ